MPAALPECKARHPLLQAAKTMEPYLQQALQIMADREQAVLPGVLAHTPMLDIFPVAIMMATCWQENMLAALSERLTAVRHMTASSKAAITLEA